MNKDEAIKLVAYWMPRGTPLNVARADIQNVVINKIYDSFNYKIDKLLEVLGDRGNEFKDNEFYKNLLLDIENLKAN